MLINTSSGMVDEGLLDNLSANSRIDFKESRNKGHAAPDGDKYECTEQIFMRSEANAADDRKNRE